MGGMWLYKVWKVFETEKGWIITDEFNRVEVELEKAYWKTHEDVKEDIDLYL